MMLLIEIALTVAAWKKGWGAKALIPGAVALGGGLLVGMMFVLVGGMPADLRGVGVVLDLFVIVVLGRMMKRGPEAASSVSETLQAIDATKAAPAAEVLSC